MSMTYVQVDNNYAFLVFFSFSIARRTSISRRMHMAYVQVDKDLFIFLIFYSPGDLKIQAYGVWRMSRWIRT